MSVLLYTAENLVASVRRKGMIGSKLSGCADADLIGHLNEQLMTLLLPAVMKAKEDYMVISRREPLSSTVSRYRVHPRAAGQALRDIWYVDAQGNRIPIYPAGRESLGERSATTGAPCDYHIEGNHIILLGSGFSGQLETSFHVSPGQLVLSTAARKISAIAGGLVSLGGSLAGGFTNTARYDIHDPNSGAHVKAIDLAVSNADGTAGTLTFTEADINGSKYGHYAAQVGDWVTLAGEAALPALPLELHPVLAQAGTVAVLEALGDPEALQVATAKLGEMFQAAGYLLEKRPGRTRRTVNRRSLLGSMGGGRW